MKTVNRIFSLRTLALGSLAALLCVGLAQRLTAQQVTAQQQGTAHSGMVQQAPANGGEQSAPDAAAPDKKEEVKDENDEYLHSPMVIKTGSMLGMNATQAATAFTVFNFALMAMAVGYMMLKLLPKTFRARNTAIQKHLVDARTATEEATSRLNSVEDRLSKLDAQIAEMRAHADNDAQRDALRLQASLEDEKSKIVAAAEAEIQSAAAAAHRDLQMYAAQLAIDQATRKLVVTAETDRLLVESFARKLGDDKGSRN